MPQPGIPESGGGISLPDVLHAIFKHKWKIVLGIIAGALAAAGFYYLKPPMFQSEARLLVRYVVEKSAVDPVENSTGSLANSRASDGVIGSEVELMTSYDLAVTVVDRVGLERFKTRTGQPSTRSEAIGSVVGGLEVAARPGSNVISIAFKYHDAEMATVILQQFVESYFEMHVKMHRDVGGYDFVTQQTARVRARLLKTEEELKRLKAEANVISLPESTANLNASLARLQEELSLAVTQRAEAEARVQAIERTMPTGEKPSTAESTPVISPADVQKYQALGSQLAQLRQAELQLLAQYNADARPVRLHRAQIADLESQQRELEKRVPALVALAPASTAGGPQPLDINAERVRLIAVEARIASLREQETTLQERARQIADLGPRIAQLELQRQQEQENHLHSENRLERAQIDEALVPAKMPNISLVQTPSPAGKVTKETQKMALMIFGGTSGLGVAFALLSGLVLDRTVKRSGQLESLLHLPVLLSIPFEKSRSRLRFRGGRRGKESTALAVSGGSGGAAVAPWDAAHFVRPFADEVRDRLSVFFDLYNIVHKPKLVAVTGMMEGAGATTLAAGLAASLSETGDGKVLLVDMSSQDAVVHPYFKGHPQVSLTSALRPSETEMAPASENLYLATATPGAEQIEQLNARKFNELVPRLMASDYDYIVFDMPALAQTSSTLAMARHMDLVLLLVEAERCTSDAVRRSWNDLAGAKANVSVIFNKARNYAPAWLQG